MIRWKELKPQTMVSHNLWIISSINLVCLEVVDCGEMVQEEKTNNQNLVTTEIDNKLIGKDSISLQTNLQFDLQEKHPQKISNFRLIFDGKIWGQIVAF